MSENQWSTVKPFFSGAFAKTSIVPEEHRERIQAYDKYDDFYWNDPKGYALRVLEGEQPLYIPNARQVVDTTSHYFLKGLKIACENKETQAAIDSFMKRETFYSRFNAAKQAGVARGDWAMHLTANPSKAEGTRIALTEVHPGDVFPIYDEDQPDKMVGCHIAVAWYKPDDTKLFVRKLTYRLIETATTRKVQREEAIYSVEENWWGPKAKIEKVILKPGFLDPRIQAIPVYWFRNRNWSGDDFGSSELRGFETMLATISQGSTDVSAALSLEGLGVYATDGGRPVDESGNETTWEVAPGAVMEVPQGSYFRRVEGVGSITPAKDQIDYLEGKLLDAAALSDVATGKVDAITAQSGIALAIRFMPTLAKIETRDQHGIDVLTQMWYDWKTWYEVFERQTLDGDIVPVIGDKLPMDRTAKLNELNNMADRGIISNAYYREKMKELGYEFPDDIEDQIAKEAQVKAEAARKAFEATQGVDSTKTSDGEETSSKDTLPSAGNRSNNASKPNESAGTEA